MTRISMEGCMPVVECDFTFIGIDPAGETFVGRKAPVIMSVNGKRKAIPVSTLRDWLRDYPSDAELLKAREAV